MADWRVSQNRSSYLDECLHDSNVQEVEATDSVRCGLYDAAIVQFKDAGAHDLLVFSFAFADNGDPCGRVSCEQPSVGHQKFLP